MNPHLGLWTLAQYICCICRLETQAAVLAVSTCRCICGGAGGGGRGGGELGMACNLAALTLHLLQLDQIWILQSVTTSLKTLSHRRGGSEIKMQQPSRHNIIPLILCAYQMLVSACPTLSSLNDHPLHDALPTKSDMNELQLLPDWRCATQASRMLLCEVFFSACACPNCNSKVSAYLVQGFPDAQEVTAATTERPNWGRAWSAEIRPAVQHIPSPTPGPCCQPSMLLPPAAQPCIKHAAVMTHPLTFSYHEVSLKAHNDVSCCSHPMSSPASRIVLQ